MEVRTAAAGGSEIPATMDRWVRRPAPSARPRLRLFCFPYAGGGRSIYRAWGSDLWPGIEVCPVQLPGREDRSREQPFTDLPSLVCELERVLLPYLDVPFALFGHSMGALISFELARLLRRNHALEPAYLFVSGRRAAQIPHSGPLFHQLPDSRLVEELRRLNGTPAEALGNARLMRQVLPILRADFTLCETYHHADEEPLACPIAAFGGLRDPMASHEEVAAWGRQTRGVFTLRLFPGDHFFIHSARSLLLYTLSQTLAALDDDAVPRSVPA